MEYANKPPEFLQHEYILSAVFYEPWHGGNVTSNNICLRLKMAVTVKYCCLALLGYSNNGLPVKGI